MRMYPVLTSDTTTIKKDTVREIKYLPLPGKIVYHHDTLSMPCKDSVRLWAIFSQQLNDILNRDSKIKQSLIFKNNALDYTLTIKTDSIKYLKETINILNDRLKKVYQGVPVYINKTSTLDIVCRWIAGVLAIAVIIGIILKIRK